MLDILEIRDNAHAVADAEGTADACPYDHTSAHGRLWLDYFYARVRWLSGETTA